MIAVTEWERRFPDIPWREPVRVTVAGVAEEAIICRACVAELGIHGYAVAERSFPTREDFDAHLEAVHA